ncbi:MAG: exodeoxyribonuclease III [Candidatus Paceibacterota bacterium]|jgi:exodeoxyribonuclease-3
MKLISWNVNGLRAIVKKDKWNQLLELDPDIFCLQETKAHPEQLPEEIRNPSGYHGCFDHSKMRKGYSGVAVFSKIKPEKVEYGFGIPKYDQEGRMLILYFKDFVLLNGYFPNGGEDPARLKYKLEFYDHFLKFIEKLRKQGRKVIFCGDVNTAHNEIDLARPKANENHTGFLRIERDWLDKVITKGYVDTFRYLHPTEVKYSWWDMKTFARDRNVGWRLDYFFISPDLLPRSAEAKPSLHEGGPRLYKAEILNNIFGSDHCPVLLELK